MAPKICDNLPNDNHENNKQQSQAEAKMLGLAIVGCGQIVTHHLEAMASGLAGKIRLRALCDPSVKQRKSTEVLVTSKYAANLLRCGGDEVDAASSSAAAVQHFDSLDDLMNEEVFFADHIDIIFIAVPHDLHESLATKALSNHNKIVVMEKPLAPTKPACDRLVQLSEELSKKGIDETNATAPAASSSTTSMLIIAEQSPFWEEVALARNMITEGTIGHVVSAASYYYESLRDNVTSGDLNETGGFGWRGSVARAGGGIAIDGGLHWIRPLREMLGRRVDRVVATVRRGLEPQLQLEGESIGHALFQMEEVESIVEPEGAGPLIATYSCSLLHHAPMAHDTCPYFRITGTKGEIVIHGDGLFRENPGAGGLRVYNEDHPKGHEMFPNDRMGGFFRGFAGLWKEIYRIGTTKDYEGAHRSVVRAADDVGVVLAMYKSAEQGCWVDAEKA